MTDKEEEQLRKEINEAMVMPCAFSFVFGFCIAIVLMGIIGTYL